MKTRILIASAAVAGVIGLAAPPNTLHAQAPARHLELQIHSLKCIDETTHTDIGADEIDLAGIRIDAAKRAWKVNTLDFGSFNRGKVKAYVPSRTLARFNLTGGPAFPRTYAVMLILTERDVAGGLGAELDRLVALANEAAAPKTREAKRALQEVAENPAAGAISAELGPTAGVAFKKAVDLATGWSRDDVFKPHVAKISIGANTFRFGGNQLSSSKERVTLKGHNGTYHLIYYWNLVL